MRLPSRVRLLHPTLRQVLWLLIGLSHAPALVGAWRSLLGSGLDPGRSSGCVGLMLVMIFCALKVYDVPCLRFHTGWHACTALGIIVALLHVNVVRPDSDLTAVPVYMAVVATTWLVGGSMSVRRKIGEAFASTGAAFKRHSSPLPSTDTLWLDMSRPHCWLLALHLYSLRAPPV